MTRGDDMPCDDDLHLVFTLDIAMRGRVKWLEGQQIGMEIGWREVQMMLFKTSPETDYG